jgi:starch synthase
MGLRIAYVHYGEQSGVTSNLAAALAALGHEVVPVSGCGPLELRHAGSRRLRLTPRVAAHLAFAVARFGLSRQALYYRQCTPYAFDVHSSFVGGALAALDPAPDVVLQNGALFAPGRPPPFPYVLAVDHTRALGERLPVVPEANVPPPPRWGEAWRRREGEAYRGAAAVASFSENTARSLVRDYGVEPARVRVVGAGANVFPERAARADDGETILFVGREFERKGGTILLDAFARLRRARPRARLLVAGPVAPLALPEGAEQLGAVPYDGLAALFARATVFAMPTLHEPYGIAFLDAMACAVPCVGTRVEAVPEIVEDGATGLLVPARDAAALAAALERLLASPDLARRMGERGRERVASRFRWPLVARRVEDLLRAAAARAGASAA